jgi:IS5 family transposase
MKKVSLPLNLNVKKTRKVEFLGQMERVVPCTELIALISPCFPEGQNSRLPFPLESMQRTHFLQLSFILSDSAFDEGFFDAPLYRYFAQLPEFTRLPDESTILLFSQGLKWSKLAEQVLGGVNCILCQRGLPLKTSTAVDATFTAVPTSTKNHEKARDREMQSSKKGNQWDFGMNAYIGADADTGLVHSVRGTVGHVADIVECNNLLHGQVGVAFGGTGYRGIYKPADAKGGVTWHVAMHPGKRRAINKGNKGDAVLDRAEILNAAIWAKVKHPFRVIKRQFAFVKVRYRGLAKNTAQLATLFDLSNLWMVRCKLMEARG